MKKSFAVLSILVLLTLVFAPQSVSAKFKPEYQKGICYVTWAKDRFLSERSDESIRELARTGATWVAVTVHWYQDSCSTTDIFSTTKTASDESLAHVIEYIHSRGMKVLLKPHIDIIDAANGGWRGEIACATEPDWDAWFKSYSGFILRYAEIAKKNRVDMFCVGTELTSSAITKDKLWRMKVIAPVRKIYKGPLTYAANWNEEYNQIKFWDALDYVGIDAYFPLSENDYPTIADLKRGWELWIRELESFQAKVNKPVIFPEIGYCSAVGTARTPWEEASKAELDLELQANCYRAFFETFQDKEWFYGAYWWRWGTDVRFGGPFNKGYSFQNKPAQDVVTEWYKKGSQVKARR